MWLIFSLLTGALYTGESLIQRFVLRQQKDAWAFASFYGLVGVVVAFPFMIVAPKIPTQPHIWLLVLLMGLLVVGNNLLLFRSSNFIEASLTGALLKLRLVWIFIFSLLFMSDIFSWPKLLGTLFAIAAGVIIVHNFKKPKSTAGILLVLGATVFNASIIVLSKYLLESFNVASMTFFAIYLPATIMMLFITPRLLPRIKKMFREDKKAVIMACALGALTNLALNAALSLHDATSVIVINEAFLVVVLVGEHIFLNEKEKPWIKLVSVSLAIMGAVLIEMSH
jgi:drug/metabolite transporter (DMT)-like permease